MSTEEERKALLRELIPVIAPVAYIVNGVERKVCLAVVDAVTQLLSHEGEDGFVRLCPAVSMAHKMLFRLLCRSSAKKPWVAHETAALDAIYHLGSAARPGHSQLDMQIAFNSAARAWGWYFESTAWDHDNGEGTAVMFQKLAHSVLRKRLFPTPLVKSFREETGGHF